MTSYRVQQIAEMPGTHPETVRRWIRDKKLNAVRVARKTGKVVTEAELQRFLNASPKYMLRFTASQMVTSPADSVPPITCPVCGETMMLDHKTRVWKCKGCDYAFSNANSRTVEILWFCDKCGKFMNKQPDINAKTGDLICTECGYGNDVSTANTVGE